MKITTLNSLKRFFVDLKEYFKPFAVQAQTITLDVENWSLVGNYYEYDIKDEQITDEYFITANPNLDNQAKMVDGSIESYNGGYKITTSKLPTDNVILDVFFQKTVAKGVSS